MTSFMLMPTSVIIYGCQLRTWLQPCCTPLLKLRAPFKITVKPFNFFLQSPTPVTSNRFCGQRSCGSDLCTVPSQAWLIHEIQSLLDFFLMFDQMLQTVELWKCCVTYLFSTTDRDADPSKCFSTTDRASSPRCFCYPLVAKIHFFK